MKIPIYSNVKHAYTTMKKAKEISNKSVEKFENQQKQTSCDLDRLGKLEMEILMSFKEFTDLHTALGITPNFVPFSKENITIPEVDLEDLKKAASGANALMDGLGAAALGTAGGFAAYGAISATALHFAISSIKGAAAIPVVHLASGATIAGAGAVGSAVTAGSSFAVAGGIVATGTGTTLGGIAMSAAGPIGLIVGGTIISISARKLAKKADKAYAEALKTKNEVNKVCRYLVNLTELSNKFYESFLLVNSAYKRHWLEFKKLVGKNKKNPLKNFTEKEKILTQNLYLLVQLLYHMCQVSLVLKEEKDGLNILNVDGINNEIANADGVLEFVKE